PPDSLRFKNARTGPTAESDLPTVPFRLDFSTNSNQSGPQRVLLNSDGSRGPPLDPIVTSDNSQLTLNRTNSLLLKRSHAEDDPNSEYSNNVHDLKRLRRDD
ncbi:hypothetical protein H0H93_002496, partial [Arthromyces matolae]